LVLIINFKDKNMKALLLAVTLAFATFAVQAADAPAAPAKADAKKAASAPVKKEAAKPAAPVAK
jgi:ribosomal protein L12E/L44/L45/RPP1/RPP2